MELRPLGGKVQRDLGKVVGHHFTAGYLHDGWHGDAAGVIREPPKVGALEPFDAQDRIHTARIQFKGPRPYIVGGSGLAKGDGFLKA